jgi:hypothetical protein
MKKRELKTERERTKTKNEFGVGYVMLWMVWEQEDITF